MVIQDGKNGLLVPVGDVESMSKAIIKLIENEDLSNRISIEAEKLRAELDEKIICKKWEDLMYEEKER